MDEKTGSATKLQTAKPQKEKRLKDDKTRRVASATLNLLLQHGIRSLNPTRVARSANVSRAWIYKYIGGSKDSLMDFAADYYGKLYSRLDSPFSDENDMAWIANELEGIQNSLRLVEENEALIPLYYRYKGTNTAIARSIEKTESIYIKKKTDQLTKALGSKRNSSRLWCEFLVAFKLAIVHRWQVGGMSKLIREEDFLLKLRSLFRMLATLVDK